MIAFLNIIHALICVSLVLSVLLQSSKGGGLAGAFGGMGDSGTMLGGRGAATFLAKLTTVLAVLFMLSSIGQGFVTRSGGGEQKSLIQQEVEQTQSAGSNLPVVPQATPGTQAQPQQQPTEGEAKEEETEKQNKN